MPAFPKPAATVILIREAAGGGIKVFLVKRSKKAAFMAETYVFPGGIVDPQDLSGEIAPFTKECDGTALSEATSADHPEALRSFRLCAVRELFEEAKILLAYSRGGSLVSFGDEERKERFGEYRRAILSGGLSMAALCEREGITLGLDRLLHYAHWITPEIHPLRFDTHFFLALCPEGQEPEPDRHEITEGLWLSPAEAIDLNARGTVTLSPPAIIVMDELGRLGYFESIVSSLTEREITPVRPVFVRLPGHVFVVFPWDPEYRRFVASDPSGPFEHGFIVSGQAAPTRVVFQDGLSLPYRKER